MLDHWDDPAQHKAFVGLAMSLGRLADAAGYYRSVQHDPARASRAEEGKQLVLSTALSQLETAPRTHRPEGMRRGAWLVPLVTLGFLFATSFLIATVTQRKVFVSPLVLALEMLLVAVLPWRRWLR